MSHSHTKTTTLNSSEPPIMRADVYDTGVLVRSNLLLPHFPAVVVAAGFRHKDFDDAVTAPVVYDDFPSRTHSGNRDPSRDTYDWVVLALPPPFGGCVCGSFPAKQNLYDLIMNIMTSIISGW